MPKDWKEEFYKKFRYIQEIENEISGNSYNRIADYFGSLLSQQRKEVLEEVEKFASYDKYNGERYLNIKEEIIKSLINKQ